MAHEITSTDSLILSSKPAWHGLGLVVENAPTPAEACKLSGLDWQVGFPKSEVATFEDGNFVNIKSSRTLYRLPSPSDSNYTELWHFGPGYVPIQNAELAELAYAFGSDVKIESAGSLQGGRKVFFLLKGETMEFGHDVVQPYLSLINSHDGTLALSVFPTSVRVVCKNTLSLALRDARGRMFKIAHAGNYQTRIKECADALKRYKSVEAAFAAEVEALRRKEVKSEQALAKFYVDIYHHLYGMGTTARAAEDAKKEIEAWDARLKAEMMELGIDAPDAWLVGNSITGHLQHGAPGRVTEGWEERRIQSSFVGEIMMQSSKVMSLAGSML